MPINWQDPVIRDRLVAAIIASVDNKVNCAEIARLFGNDATYNTIENALRPAKKMAKELKEAAAGKDGPTPSTPRGKSAVATSKTTPRKKAAAENGVKTGRVTKTPNKKASNRSSTSSSPVKKEDLGDGIIFGSGTDTDNIMDEDTI